MTYVEVETVATECGISKGRVRQLISAGTLKAKKEYGRWLITRAELDRFRALTRIVGRPKNG